MKTKIYKIENVKAFMANELGTVWALSGNMQNTPYYEADVKGPFEFDLPKGYTVAYDALGDMQVYDSAGHRAEIVREDNGIVKLVGAEVKVWFHERFPGEVVSTLDEFGYLVDNYKDDDWAPAYNDIIEAHGWENLAGENQWDICRDGRRRLTLKETGRETVIVED